MYSTVYQIDRISFVPESRYTHYTGLLLQKQTKIGWYTSAPEISHLGRAKRRKRTVEH